MKIEAQIDGWSSYRFVGTCSFAAAQVYPIHAEALVPRVTIRPETALTPIKTPTENLLWWVQPAFMLWLLGFSCALYWAWHR